VGDEANYTWHRNGRWLRGGLSPSLVLARVSSADAGSYGCRASGTRGSGVSAPLGLSVLCECPPAPRGQPTGQDGAQTPLGAPDPASPARAVRAAGPSSPSSSSPCPAPDPCGMGERVLGVGYPQ